jgi:hypothetical protein
MKYLPIAVLLLLSGRAYAYEQTFDSCSVVAWQIFDAIENYRLGIPLEKARSVDKYPHNIEAAYKLANDEGLETAYMTAHLHYKRCAAEVEARARQSISSSEGAYRECAWASAARTNVLLAIVRGASTDDTKSKLPPQLHSLVDALYRRASEGNPTAALAASADASRTCIQEARSRERSRP